MAIQIDAIYQDGVLRPSAPLDRPDSTPVIVTVTPAVALQGADGNRGCQRGRRITVDEFRRIMKDCTIKAPPLPPDWDRHDVYSDHD
ncbi:MAG: hypothetical protein DCC67_10095 [Planctomycetota bacterium]|nr:MAG: hypothetical protein DCC67_10095 [Planctomycetota bacterium]